MTEVKIRIQPDPEYRYAMEITAYLVDGTLCLAVPELAYDRGRIEIVQGEDAGIIDFGREHLIRSREV